MALRPGLSGAPPEGLSGVTPLGVLAALRPPRGLSDAPPRSLSGAPPPGLSRAPAREPDPLGNVAKRKRGGRFSRHSMENPVSRQRVNDGGRTGNRIRRHDEREPETSS